MHQYRNCPGEKNTFFFSARRKRVYIFFFSLPPKEQLFFSFRNVPLWGRLHAGGTAESNATAPVLEPGAKFWRPGCLSRRRELPFPFDPCCGRSPPACLSHRTGVRAITQQAQELLWGAAKGSAAAISKPGDILKLGGIWALL